MKGFLVSVARRAFLPLDSILKLFLAFIRLLCLLLSYSIRCSCCCDVSLLCWQGAIEARYSRDARCGRRRQGSGAHLLQAGEPPPPSNKPPPLPLTHVRLLRPRKLRVQSGSRCCIIRLVVLSILEMKNVP